MTGAPMIAVNTSEGIDPRGISPATTQKYTYGWGAYKGDTVQVAEYRDAAGIPVAQKLRLRDKTFLWLGDPKAVGLFGDHTARKGGRRITITEGELDALAASQVQGNTWPVVSIPNGAQSAVASVTKALEWLEGYGEVIICFDEDEAGRKASAEVAQLFTPGKAKITSLPLKDACEMVMRGKGDTLRGCLWEARTFQPDGIKMGEEVLASMLDVGRGRQYTSYHPGINAMLRGFRTGKIYTLCAGSGIGKSTITKEEGVNLLDQMDDDQRLGCVMLEEGIGESALHFCTIKAGRPLHLDEPIADDDENRGSKMAAREIELREHWSHYGDRVVLYDHFGSLGSKNLLSRIRYMVLALKCKWVILDHISIVVSGMDISDDERRTIDHLMTSLRSMVQELDFGLILVSHLKRLQGGQKGFEQGTEPQLSHLRGSAAIEQISDVVIGLGRNQQCAHNPTVIHARLLKNRPASLTGSAGYLDYSLETGRLLPCAKPSQDDTDEGHGFEVEDDPKAVATANSFA